MPRLLSIIALVAAMAMLVAACEDDAADDTPAETDDTPAATDDAPDDDADSDESEDASDDEETDDAASDDDASDDEVSDEDASDDEETEDVEATGSWHDEREIVFADYNWDSAMLVNRIAQFVIEEGYGYSTETIPGETIPLFQGQLDGSIDISMEIWIDQMPPYEPALEEGEVVQLGNSVDNTVQGWWVPTYMIEGDEERGIEPMTPDLEHVDDLSDYWEVFEDPDDDSKGRLYDGVPGWELERINEVKFAYYGLDEHYNRFLPGSGAALNTSLVSAYEQGEPWLGYMWTPTWVSGQLDITLLEEPEYSDECWEEVQQAVEEEREAETACAWPVTEAVIAARSDFVEEAPDIAQFLEHFNTDESHISAALAYMVENEVDSDEAAIWFLEEYEDLWIQWVPDDVADRVQDAL